MTLECCNRMAKELWQSQSMLDEFAEDYNRYVRADFDIPGSNGPETRPYRQEFSYKNESGIIKKYSYCKGLFGYKRDSGTVFYDDYPGTFGFSSQYGIPQSQKTDYYKDYLMWGYKPEDARRYADQYGFSFGGLYPSRMDMNGFFGVGQEYGKMKLRGYKAHHSDYVGDYLWSIVQSPVVSGIQGIYPPGAVGSVLRDDEGYRDILWQKITHHTQGGTLGFDIYSYGWRKVAPYSSFSRATDDGFKRGYSMPPTQSDTKYRLNTTLPTESQNFSAMILELPGDNQTYCFQHKIGYVSSKYGQHTNMGFRFTSDLCREGNMVLKVSKYNDLLTNEEHKDKYIEVLRSTEVEMPAGFEELRQPKKIRINSTPISLPLKKGITYYFYIEYENGCCQEYLAPLGTYGNPAFSVLCATASHRMVKWPSAYERVETR